MANRILNMIFRADTKDAKRKMDDLQGREGQAGGVMGLKGALDGLITPALAAAGALYGVTAVVKNEIDSYNDYITEVDNLAASLGLTYDEASFLKGSMDEFAISNDTMVAVFRKLASEGVDPTVESLGELLEQWEAMEEGAEKGQFAMEMFGEQGIKQILPWWDKLTDAQKENFGAIEDYIEVTPDMVQSSREYQEAVFNLKTEWSLFKQELLQGVIPALTSVINFMTKYKQTVTDFAQGIRDKLTAAAAAAQVDSGFRGQGVAGAANPESTWVDPRRNRPGGWATGGQFVVGGGGGSDSTPVSFMATPGETVSIGGGTNDNQQILAEMRRLVNTLPTVLTDAMERR